VIAPRISYRAFQELVGARQGHFRLESGLHSRLWLDLDALFANPERIEPYVTCLAEALRPHRVTAVCGPLVGGAFLAQSLAGRMGAEFLFTERRTPPADGGLFQARYLMPPAVASRVAGRRVAIVDDVMSAGSSLRSTYAEVQRHGGDCAVVGALLVLGSVGAGFFDREGVPVEAVLRHDFESWDPAQCPLCATGAALEE
jgi:orotate phosphoribosyltransferase